MTYGSLFSGVGGIDLGLDAAGLHCRWQCEIDPFAQRILAKHWPGVKRYGDITKLTGDELEPVDLIAGGFPCQDLSQAGKRIGIEGTRSGLWFEFARIVGELRPRYVLVENVPGLLVYDGLRRVIGGHFAAFGLPPSLPLLREASRFALERERPPRRPRIAIAARTISASVLAVRFFIGVDGIDLINISVKGGSHGSGHRPHGFIQFSIQGDLPFVGFSHPLKRLVHRRMQRFGVLNKELQSFIDCHNSSITQAA